MTPSTPSHLTCALANSTPASPRACQGRCVAIGATARPFRRSPSVGGHGDAGLSFQLGPVAKRSAQRSQALNVDQRAGFQPAQVRFFLYPITQPPGCEEVGYGPFDLLFASLHKATPVLVFAP